MQEEAQEYSKYNEAVYQIFRLNECWNNCNSYIRGGDLEKWKWELDIIFLELYSDFMRQNDKDLEQDHKDLIKQISKAETDSEKYKALFNRHKFLKEIQDLVGKGARYEDRTVDDFE